LNPIVSKAVTSIGNLLFSAESADRATIGRTTHRARAVPPLTAARSNGRRALIAGLHPSFRDNAYANIGTRLQETQQRVDEMSTEQIEQRVAHVLPGLV
jgi:hypothetical protein